MVDVENHAPADAQRQALSGTQYLDLAEFIAPSHNGGDLSGPNVQSDDDFR
jgi:hypothetical protein